MPKCAASALFTEFRGSRKSDNWYYFDFRNHGFDYSKRYDEANTLESFHKGITDSTWALRGGKFDINDPTTYRSPIREALPFGSDKGFDRGMGQRMIDKLEPAEYESFSDWWNQE